jgi:outer membrane biosynthesis protein TonB
MLRSALLTSFLVMGCTTPKATQAPDEKQTEVAKTEPVAEPTKPVAEPAKPEPVAEPVAEPAKEPVKTEPVKTEPVKAEPVKAEPAKQPVKAEPAKEPVKAEPAKEPVKAEPAKEPVKAEPTKTAVAAPDKKIERLWKSKCGSCHGMDGKAATDKGRKMKMNDMTVASWQAARTDAQLKKAITDGVKTEKAGVTQEMDGYSDLAADQLAGLVQYVRWVGAPH